MTDTTRTTAKGKTKKKLVGVTLAGEQLQSMAELATENKLALAWVVRRAAELGFPSLRETLSRAANQTSSAA